MGEVIRPDFGGKRAKSWRDLRERRRRDPLLFVQTIGGFYMQAWQIELLARIGNDPQKYVIGIDPARPGSDGTVYRLLGD